MNCWSSNSTVRHQELYLTYLYINMSEESYEDVREITQLDKIWEAQTSDFEKYVAYLLVLSVIFLIGMCLLILIGWWVYILIDTIIAYSSGRNPRYFAILILTGIFVVPLMFLIVIVSLALIFGEREDLRYLIRFKILALGLELSEDKFSVIEALTRSLESNKGWFIRRRYKRKILNYTQLKLVHKYLMEKYQRDVTLNECLEFFSIGIMTSTESGSRKYKDYSFVMLDERKGEILFYSEDYDEWLYLRKELEGKGFHISDIRETTVDMIHYVINDDGTIERSKKRKKVENVYSLQDSEIKNV